MNSCLGWHRIPDSRITLSEILFDHGYVTGLVGDVFHMFKPNMNFHRGFMHWHFVRGQEADPVRCGPLDAVDIRPHVPQDEAAGAPESPLYTALRQYLIGVQGRRREEDYFTPQVFRNAVRFLEDNHRRPPWLLWIESFAPHEYWDPPRAFADRYFRDPQARDYILPQIGQNREGNVSKTPAEIERTKALYYGYVTFVDKWIGVLLEQLDRLRLLDETIVMFLSDHGTELMDNGVFSKNIHGPRDYNQRLNWIVRLPGAAHAGTHVEPFVLSHDVPATILDLLGIESPEPLQGRSAWPLVTGAASDLHGDTIVSGWVERACVRDREWAYIVDTVRPDAEPLLFHTAVDPAESHDVASAYPALADDRRRNLEDFLGGPLPFTYGHQPDRRNIMTLARHLEIRRRLGIAVQSR
jgi:arylsulfatase A-like enzyme